MSADTRPISPERFAAALTALSPAMLHLKVLEIRNSIAHLQYSNDQLKPFAEGTESAVDGNPSGPGPDQDCIDAIRENEVVIDRMIERIALVRAEVEERGMSWSEFRSKEEVEAAADGHADAVNGTNGQTHSAWTDGTFQTGTIRGGDVHFDDAPATAAPPTTADTALHGGTLDDEELRRRMEERMRDLDEGDDDEGGMHL